MIKVISKGKISMHLVGKILIIVLAIAAAIGFVTGARLVTARGKWMGDLQASKAAEEKSIQIQTHFISPGYAEVDPNRMRQAFGNLLDNAVKYTPNGGLVEIECDTHDEKVVVTIRDNGMGIPPAEQNRIWDRLYRGDTSRSQRGLGLGLSLVKAVVEAHAGTISLKSEPGKGSEFIVTLAAAVAARLPATVSSER